MTATASPDPGSNFKGWSGESIYVFRFYFPASCLKFESLLPAVLHTCIRYYLCVGHLCTFTDAKLRGRRTRDSLLRGDSAASAGVPKAG